ncbi:MAG: DUF4670 domain-containing protein [Eubacterium sp.]|nr:DUF4670 domain-containing protein [Eubacterium sp.]
MKILKGFLAGLGIGIACGILVGLVILGFQDILAFVTCSTYDSGFAKKAAYVCVLIGGGIGAIAGIFDYIEDKKMEKEQAEEKARREKEQAEEKARWEWEQRKQQKQYEKDKRFNDWSKQLKTYYLSIEGKKNVSSIENTYDLIQKMKLTADVSDKRYDNEFRRQILEHVGTLRSRILNYSNRKFAYQGEKKVDHLGLEDTIYVCKCLLIADKIAGHNDNGTRMIKPLLDIIQPLNEEAKRITHYLTFETYGKCYLPLDDFMEMAHMEKNAISLENKLSIAKNYVMYFSVNKSILQDNILPEFDRFYIKESVMLMWYYAKKKPFDAGKFKMAKRCFDEFTNIIIVEKKKNEKDKYIEIGSVEEILARIYAKNQIGGMGTACQEKDYIDLWLKKKVEWCAYEECYMLASGLAWMELYDLEQDVLRNLVKAGVRLPEDIQDRLSFLESGGINSVKIYEIGKSDCFVFDNSALEWGTKEYDAFFRKLIMKKMYPNYSLALDKWTKTLPLISGQKVDFERIYDELKNLTEDFDGEIVFQIVDAKAIDLENIKYEKAIAFRFTSERNRCVSVLFSCEKYGRNLNLTILTMFTPDMTIAIESLEKYCLAIKNNSYVESFRESILQTIDEALKIRESMYEDEEHPVKKRIFDAE